MRCFRCGGQGHVARDCPNEERQRPCYLCAQYGHARAQCTNSARPCAGCSVSAALLQLLLVYLFGPLFLDGVPRLYLLIWRLSQQASSVIISSVP